MSNVSADKTFKCSGLKWSDKGHDDNVPSTSKFKQMAYHGSLCDIAKCVDLMECSNHVAVDWNKFQNSPAFTGATEDQQKELIKAHEHGNGMNGLGGYEIQYIVEDTD